MRWSATAAWRRFRTRDEAIDRHGHICPVSTMSMIVDGTNEAGKAAWGRRRPVVVRSPLPHVRRASRPVAPGGPYARPVSGFRPISQAAGPATQATNTSVPFSALVVLAPPRPVYPTASKRAGEQGEALLYVTVDINGLPSMIVLQRSSGHAALDDSAIDAVKAMRFRPFTENGKPRHCGVDMP